MKTEWRIKNPAVGGHKSARRMVNHRLLVSHALPRYSLLVTRRFPNGFTLIELLVVVSIIMILAAIVGPMYRSFIQGAGVETGRNVASSVISQGRTLAMKLGREVMVFGYWRRPDVNGTMDPNGRRDNSMSMVIFPKDVGWGYWGNNAAQARTPTCNVKIGTASYSTMLVGGFFPQQELALPGNTAGNMAYDDYQLSPRDPNTSIPQGDPNAVTPLMRLPAGIALAKPAQNLGTGEYYYEDFVMFRFRPDGTMSFEPPVEGSDQPPGTNLANWLNRQWRMQQPAGGGLGIDQINGDTADDRARRGFYMVLPTNPEAKLPTNVFVVYDRHALEESGIDLNNQAQVRNWINQNGTLGTVNTNTGVVTYSTESEKR